VYLETRNEGRLAEGRLHFVEGSRHRSTGWIFRQWTERDIVDPFQRVQPDRVVEDSRQPQLSDE
jgi:hypothetical protein